MSRFGKLEFETGPDSSGQQSLRPAAGETHWSSEAERAFCLGDFELALRLFARVLEHNPTSVPAWAGQVRSLILVLGVVQPAWPWLQLESQRIGRIRSPIFQVRAELTEHIHFRSCSPAQSLLKIFIRKIR
jgi:hypothetical protein